jgi:hypothetical protein
MPETGKVLQKQKAGTTKVFVCDSVDTGFDYLIFSESKSLIRSIQTSIQILTGFSAVFQPTISTPVYRTGKYGVGIANKGKRKQQQQQHQQQQSQEKQEKQDKQETQDDALEPPMTCETLRQVLESRPEVKCIEHDQLLNLMKTLYTQMYDLETTHRQAIPYISLDDIIIVNDAFAVFINDDKLFQINQTQNDAEETIDVTRAIGREEGAFYPPELSGGKIASLPYTVNVRCAYYSFGMMVAYCATLNPQLVMKSAAIQKLNLKKEGVLSSIEGTKLYWFILRCCASNPKNRTMLYV